MNRKRCINILMIILATVIGSIGLLYAISYTVTYFAFDGIIKTIKRSINKVQMMHTNGNDFRE